MKRIAQAVSVAALVLGLSGGVSVEWQESELPHAYCYAYGSQGITCNPKPEGVVSPAPTAAPSSTRPPAPTATPISVSLINGGFENDILGWTPFNLAVGVAQNVAPDMAVVRRAAHEGERALELSAHWACYRSGVMQTVGAPSGTRLRASAWGLTWANAFILDLSRPTDFSVNDGLSVGLDPFGGTNARSSAVVWNEDGATEQWRAVAVEATALSSRVTVFVVVNLGSVPGGCAWPLQSMYGWLDDATLEVAP